MTKNDRAVQALINECWLGEWERPVDGHDLAEAAALVIRVARDDLVMAWQDGQISDLLGAERLLNERIVALTGRPTITGDTTEATEPEPADDGLDSLTALVTVDERGRLTTESTVTVGEWTWPVPLLAEHGGVLWASRVAQVLREHGYQPTDIDVNEDASPAGTALVRVRPVEDS